MTQPDPYPLLSLLASAIFADKRTYASEVTMFVKSAKRLQAAGHLDPKLSEAAILMWYEVNKDAIRQKMVQPHFEAWFYQILDKLAYISEKRLILEVMCDIAEADGDVHVSETALIALAARRWRLAA